MSKSETKRLTRQQAIREMCKQCIYDPKHGNGTWVQQTQGRESRKCPLWPYRPIQRAKPCLNPLSRIDALGQSQQEERKQGENSQ